MTTNRSDIDQRSVANGDAEVNARNLSEQGTKRRVAWIVFLVTVLIRAGVGFWQIEQLDADPDAYMAISETLSTERVYGLTTADGEVVPTAFRPPLYPFVLSCLSPEKRPPPGVIVLFHALLAGVTAVMTFLSCMSLIGRNSRLLLGILAAILVTVDPILLQQSTRIMTETLAATIASVVIYWWIRNFSGNRVLLFAGGLGLLLSLAFLCRPTFVVWAGMLIVGVAVLPLPNSQTRSMRLQAAAVASIMVALVIGCWTMRNAVRIGAPVWATTHGGYTLLLGNNPLYYRHLRENGALKRWDAEPFLRAYAHRYEGDPATEPFWFQDWNFPVRAQPELSASLTESEDDRHSYEAAKSTIRREPKMFAWACLVRVYRLWTPLPYATNERSSIRVVAIGAYYGVLLLAAIVGFVRMRPMMSLEKWWPILTIVLTLTLVHAVYWSNMRMRAPAVPALAILAACAFVRVRDVRQLETGEV